MPPRGEAATRPLLRRQAAAARARRHGRARAQASSAAAARRDAGAQLAALGPVPGARRARCAPGSKRGGHLVVAEPASTGDDMRLGADPAGSPPDDAARRRRAEDDARRRPSRQTAPPRLRRAADAGAPLAAERPTSRDRAGPRTAVPGLPSLAAASRRSRACAVPVLRGRSTPGAGDGRRGRSTARAAPRRCASPLGRGSVTVIGAGSALLTNRNRCCAATTRWSSRPRCRLRRGARGLVRRPTKRATPLPAAGSGTAAGRRCCSACWRWRWRCGAARCASARWPPAGRRSAARWPSRSRGTAAFLLRDGGDAAASRRGARARRSGRAQRIAGYAALTPARARRGDRRAPPASTPRRCTRARRSRAARPGRAGAPTSNCWRPRAAGSTPPPSALAAPSSSS